MSTKNPNVLLLSVSLPIPPPETVFLGGLPFGAIEAIKAAYGVIVQILDPPRDGFNLTLKLNLSKLPPDEGSTSSFSKVIIALPCIRQKHIGSWTVCRMFHLGFKNKHKSTEGIIFSCWEFNNYFCLASLQAS